MEKKYPGKYIMHYTVVRYIISMLTPFYEKANSPAMIKHGMNILWQITQYLNPGQASVLTCDCPVFAQAKYLQWNWSELYGEEKFTMFEGPHIEQALWSTLGDMLDCYGWTNVLTEATVVKSRTSDLCLKAAQITRTRKTHKRTVLALFILQKKAYEFFESAKCLLSYGRKIWQVKFQCFSFRMLYYQLKWKC